MPTSFELFTNSEPINEERKRERELSKPPSLNYAFT